MDTRNKKLNSTKVNFIIDFIIFLAFLTAMDPRTTGIAIHEWLSIAFSAALIVHLLMHWEWIVAVTRRFLSKTVNQARTNYVLNALFFISMTVVCFTGIMISEVALPTMGIEMPRNFFWRWLHSFSADATLIVLGLHVALHWKWIVNTTKRYVLKSFVARTTIGSPKETQA